MKLSKKLSRLRRAKKVRGKIRRLGMPRFSVHKTPRHIYVQVISADGATTLASASTLDKAFNKELSPGNVKAATEVGKMIAERAKAAGVETVAFDRSGFRFHGRIKALADAAREGGINF